MYSNDLSSKKIKEKKNCYSNFIMHKPLALPLHEKENE